MRERPILFSSPMVRAILAGTKTVTRRVVGVDEPAELVAVKDGAAFFRRPDDPACGLRVPCRYGVPSDRLWVREAWRTSVKLDARNGTEIAKECLDAGYHRPWAPIEYGADGARHDWNGLDWGDPGRARSARFMPRWASRITLEVLSVRVERVQEITEEDARREGARQYGGEGAVYESLLGPGTWNESARGWFAELWESINAARGFGWDANPWVWRVEFRRVA